ncbi:MAG: hypothetical protein K2M89_06235 [Clostridiales bacterium]|nr:hypothetical protein [Clostridiales bacterium]
MARKRMISPEIWESSSFSKLTDFAKLIFIGLISNADDEGKGKANPGYIRSKLFPNDEERRVTDIKKALSEIALTMSITFYEVNGDSLYHLTNWARWQKIDRPTPSKFPNPPKEQSMGERGNCTQNQALDEGSTNTRRILDEGSPLIEKNRIEKNEKEESAIYVNSYNAGAHARMDPPSVDEVREYCREIGSAIDAQRFVDYYTANGWMVGKNPMRDWKAMVRRWGTLQFGDASSSAPKRITYQTYTDEELNAMFTQITEDDTTAS